MQDLGSLACDVWVQTVDEGQGRETAHSSARCLMGTAVCLAYMCPELMMPWTYAHNMVACSSSSPSIHMQKWSTGCKAWQAFRLLLYQAALGSWTALSGPVFILHGSELHTCWRAIVGASAATANRAGVISFTFLSVLCTRQSSDYCSSPPMPVC